jgi:hypothetical protein
MESTQNIMYTLKIRQAMDNAQCKYKTKDRQLKLDKKCY